MSIAYICSPYRAETKEKFDEQYKHTKEVAREVVLGGLEVIAPHLYYPKFLDDDCDTERFTGLQSALRLTNVCDVIFVSMKQEVSKGMEDEIRLAGSKSIDIFYFRNMNELRDLLKKVKIMYDSLKDKQVDDDLLKNETSQNRATNAKVPHNKTQYSLEKNITDNLHYLENKMSIVLDCATGGRISKPYTDINHICEAINRQETKLREEAVKDHKEETRLEINKKSHASDNDNYFNFSTISTKLKIPNVSAAEEKCEDCLHHPKPNEDYPEECVMCSLFYSSNWEKK